MNPLILLIYKTKEKEKLLKRTNHEKKIELIIEQNENISNEIYKFIGDIFVVMIEIHFYKQNAVIIQFA